MRPSTKYLAIYKNKSKYSIAVLCTFFGVSRSGYYGYVNRMGKPDRNEKLVAEIASCQKQSNRTYGYRRVYLWLQQKRSLYLNPKTVLHLMNKYNLLSQIRRRKKYKQMGQQLHKYENLLNRNFEATAPNQKWVTDISYICTKQGVLYLSMIRDAFDRSIVSYKTGTEQTVNLVLETVKAAMRKEKVTTELQLHSDQGFQYTSHGYFNLTKEYGITPSMSRRGNCYDNALAENFFSILKSECIYRVRPKTFNEAKELIDEYIYFYNYERIQLKTKLTPYEKRCQFA
ncbi:IS3 family transposase [Sporomusa aerivorans]|uniref:IS3 family transposase n=1 Tax=Sporomusa aerivorans TaxID=204936 RepID=UPI00352B3A5D